MTPVDVQTKCKQNCKNNTIQIIPQSVVRQLTLFSQSPARQLQGEYGSG
jgi:hypothetical protein